MRSDDERARMKHTIDRLRATLDAVEVALALRGPFGTEAAQAITQTSTELACQIAKHDAYELAEADAADRLQRRLHIGQILFPEAYRR
jgi:hypothetical protein